ncbi:MAG: hypothetical protein ACREGD_03890 [Candidatus Saccharimonadales bacterium]
MNARTGISTPNQWLESKLREAGISNSALARTIGRSRTEVQRWVNSREQIPKHQLAEIAAHIGTVKDLEYAMQLKECEDFADALERRLRDFCRTMKVDLDTVAPHVFDLLLAKTSEEKRSTDASYPSVLLYNMTRANFIFRTWTDAASARNYNQLVSPDNIKVHLQYPSNHFFGLILHLDLPSDTAQAQRELAVRHIRHTAEGRDLATPSELPSQHAIHMLARFGSQADQELVEDLLHRAAGSDDLLSIRLGYAGLITSTGDADTTDKYVWLMSKDERLYAVDILFEAVHYGDITFDYNGEFPKQATKFNSALERVLQRFEHPNPPATWELEALRLGRLLGAIGGKIVDRPDALTRIRNAVDSSEHQTRSSILALKKMLSRLSVQSESGR